MKETEFVLSEPIVEKLAEAVRLYSEEYLNGKPTLLANAMYYALESTMIKQNEKITKLFGDKQ